MYRMKFVLKKVVLSDASLGRDLFCARVVASEDCLEESCISVVYSCFLMYPSWTWVLSRGRNCSAASSWFMLLVPGLSVLRCVWDNRALWLQCILIALYCGCLVVVNLCISSHSGVCALALRVISHNSYRQSVGGERNDHFHRFQFSNQNGNINIHLSLPVVTCLNPFKLPQTNSAFNKQLHGQGWILRYGCWKPNLGTSGSKV